MMLKIWNNYYLDADRVCYTLKKAHTKADGGVEYNICTYSYKAGGGAGRSCKAHDPGGSRQRGAENGSGCVLNSNGWRARRGGCCSPSARRTRL